jgi:hypothetical protein
VIFYYFWFGGITIFKMARRNAGQDFHRTGFIKMVSIEIETSFLCDKLGRLMN